MTAGVKPGMPVSGAFRALFSPMTPSISAALHMHLRSIRHHNCSAVQRCDEPFFFAEASRTAQYGTNL